MEPNQNPSAAASRNQSMLGSIETNKPNKMLQLVGSKLQSDTKQTVNDLIR